MDVLHKSSGSHNEELHIELSLTLLNLKLAFSTLVFKPASTYFIVMTIKDIYKA